jgi:predicted helicase
LKFANFAELEDYTSGLFPEKKKGDFFEKFCEFYFRYRSIFFQAREVYTHQSLPKAIRERLHLESSDYGVDGVIVRFDGSLVAYQAKFRSNRISPTVRELATFWAEGQHADEKLVISNCTELPRQSGKHGISVLGTELDALDNDFFDAFEEFLNENTQRYPPRKKPYRYQTDMITGVLEGFTGSSKGKLIAACGTGKTLVSLWIAENLQAKTVLFLAPSLALIKQTLDSWSVNSATPFSFLAVCSDETVVSSEYDYADYSAKDVGFSVTTDASRIRQFIDSPHEGNRPKYIFSTYQSAGVLIAGFQASSLEQFDLVLFDEAHKTAGAANTQSNVAILDDQVLKSNKKLFMTATERLVSPWLSHKAVEAQRVVFSMDDVAVYGPTLFTYDFGTAIKDKVIADYKILVSAVSSADVARQVIQRQLVSLTDDSSNKILQADLLFRQLILRKAFQTKPISKALTFHNTVARAKSFSLGAIGQCEALSRVLRDESSELYVDYVDGSMTANERKRRLAEFSEAKHGVISNAKCLTEGVDVPLIDAIYFADPKTSIVDIVQACGRALRKPPGTSEKTSYIVVPVMLDDAGEVDEGDFRTVLKVLQALRSQDERLAQYIDKLNLAHAKGKGTRSTGELIEFDWPQDFDANAFSESIQLKVLEGLFGPLDDANREDLERRRSGSQKILKVIGDYSPETMKSALVIPTLEKLRDLGGAAAGSDLRFQNNNVAQTERLGLIEQRAREYTFTDAGTALLSGKVGFSEMFVGAYLNFRIQDQVPPVLPYKVLLQVLLGTMRLTFPQFVFGPYSIKNGSSEEISRAINNAREIVELYPNLENLSDRNRRMVLEDLNERFETNYELNEVWGSTTVMNRFGYFKSHLSLIKGVIADSKSIWIDPDAFKTVAELLK